MGATQSRQRDACTQTSPFECRKAITEVPVGSYSTLFNMPVCAGQSATIKIALDARTTQPPHKRRKYDPNCSRLKSKFADESICSQHLLLTRKVDNATLQIMADPAVGQRTLKGFPSYRVLRRKVRRKKIVKRQDSSKGFEMNVQNNSTLPIFKFKLNKKVEFVDSVASTSLCESEILTESENKRNKKLTFEDSVALESSVCVNSTLTGSESQQNKKVASLESVAPEPWICKNSNLTEFESQEKENMTIANPVAPEPLACSKSTQTDSENKQNKKVNSVARGPLVCINSTLTGSESQRNKEVTFVDSLAPAEAILRNSNLTEFESQEKENMTITDPIAPEPSLHSKSTEPESKRNKIVTFQDSASIRRNLNLTEYKSQVKNEFEDDNICTERIPLHRKEDNATLKGFLSNKVLRRKKRSKKTTNRHDSSDDEMNIQRNKKVTFVDSEIRKRKFVDSVAPAPSIRRNSNLTKYESPVKKTVTISDPIARVPSILRNPTSRKETERNKKLTYAYSVAPASSLRTNSNLTKYGSHVKTEFEDKSICTQHNTLPRKMDNAALQIMADAVVGQHTSKVLRKRIHSKKTRQDSSDDFEVNIKRDKKVTFMDSVGPTTYILRNPNLTEYECQQNKKVSFVDSVAPAPSIRRNSNLTKYESQQIKKMSFEDSIPPPRKKDNATLQIMANAVMGQHILQGFPSNKVLKKRMHRKKTVTCQDSSDDFEIDIKRNKKVAFVDSVAPSVYILRNSNLSEYECQQNKKVSILRDSNLTKYESSVNKDMTIVDPMAPLPSIRKNSTIKKSKSERNKYMTFEDSVAPSPSILKNSTSAKSESQRNKNVAFVDSVGPALLTRRHSALSKSVNNRNQKVLFENSTAPANSIRKNWPLPKYEIQRKKRVTFADPIASSIATRSNSTLPQYEIQRKKEVTFADSVASAPPNRSRSTFTKSENSRTKMVAFADSIAPVKFILTNSPLPKYENQRNKRVTHADHIVPEPLSVKDDTTGNCFHDARKYYDFNISNEKLFTDTEDDDGKKLNPREKRSSQLNYNSDSSGHSIPTVKLTYEMRKIYYYL